MNLQCSLVQDLIPVYAAGVTNTTSSEFIEMHCLSCAVCRKALEKAKTELVLEADRTDDTPEIIWQEITDKLREKQKKKKQQKNKHNNNFRSLCTYYCDLYTSCCFRLYSL